MSDTVDGRHLAEELRAAFPALHQEIRGHRLTYLDSAATALKPRAVIDAVCSVWERDCANIHRGVHLLSQRATERYESARKRILAFLGAKDKRELIFVRGATEAINLVAYSYGLTHLQAGDEIVVSGLEHHANIVPWQVVREKTGAVIKVVPIEDNGEVTLEAFSKTLSSRTKLVAVTQVSNAFGTILPIAEIVERAHAVGAKVLVDGAQSAPHLPVDVKALDVDFFVFSGHKVYGPDGTGILYAKRELLENMTPYQTGGDMILSVTFDKTLYNELPSRFEAGTPNIAGAVGLGAAIELLERVGFDYVTSHEQALLELGNRELTKIPGLRLIGTAPRKVGVLSFVLEGIHPHDIGTVLDGRGIAVRTGHHCAQPAIERMGLPATVRASLGLYNNEDDILALVDGVKYVKEMFG